MNQLQIRKAKARRRAQTRAARAPFSMDPDFTSDEIIADKKENSKKIKKDSGNSGQSEPGPDCFPVPAEYFYDEQDCPEGRKDV